MPPPTPLRAKCETKFDSSCTKAQGQGDCNAQTQLCDAIEVRADACVDSLSGAFAQAQSSCDAGVTKAAAKKVTCKLKAIAAAQKSSSAVDTTKLTRCEEKFASACAKAKSKGDCQAQTSSCGAVETEADACVADLIGAPPTTTTSSTTTTTLDPLRPCGRDPDGTCGGVC